MTESYNSVAVVGAGLMGHALALVHAIGGCYVQLNDVCDEKLDWAKSRLEVLTTDLVGYGLLGHELVETVLNRVSYEVSLGTAVLGADLVVEAIIEDASAKRALYARLDGLMEPDAILASNTSFLDVFPLIPENLLPRSLIAHWYTPPYLIDLVDVVPSPKAAPEVAQRMGSFLTSIGKKPVLLRKFVPGYIANNVQMAIESEIFRLLDTGVANAAEIDDAIRYGLASRLALMGQFKKIDYTGLQVVRDIHASGDYVPPERPTGTPRLDALLSEGASGLLAGRGFYDYSEADPTTYLARRDRKLVKLKTALKGDDEPL